jgi:hypothetical protein
MRTGVSAPVCAEHFAGAARVGEIVDKDGAGGTMDSRTSPAKPEREEGEIIALPSEPDHRENREPAFDSPRGARRENAFSTLTVPRFLYYAVKQ